MITHIVSIMLPYWCTYPFDDIYSGFCCKAIRGLNSCIYSPMLHAEHEGATEQLAVSSRILEITNLPLSLGVPQLCLNCCSRFHAPLDVPSLIFCSIFSAVQENQECLALEICFQVNQEHSSVLRISLLQISEHGADCSCAWPFRGIAVLKLLSYFCLISL